MSASDPRTFSHGFHGGVMSFMYMLIDRSGSDGVMVEEVNTTVHVDRDLPGMQDG